MDMSLLKPLSEILGVSVNDILSGEKIPEDKIKDKSEENIIKLSEFNHYKSVTVGTTFILVTIAIIIIYSLVKNIECSGYTTLLDFQQLFIFININKTIIELYYCVLGV